jgi:hypothetical protein
MLAPAVSAGKTRRIDSWRQAMVNIGAHRRKAMVGLVAVAAAALTLGTTTAVASTPGSDVRLTNDDPSTAGYVSDYTLTTGAPYTDATLAECSRSRGRENEPAVAVNPRDPNVIVGSSNDYCGVYNDGVDDFNAPNPSGPIWLGYYRSENGGTSFTSSLVPGYPGDTSPYAARAQIRTASAGDPVVAWDGEGRLFAGSESSDDPAGTKKTFGDEWVATFANPQGPGGATANDGKEFVRSVVVARGTSAPNLLGNFQDKTAIEADHTQSVCRNNVYFANSRFSGANGGANIYFYRSTDHGATFSSGTLLTKNVNDVQDPEIAVTSNGHVYVTYDATVHQGNQTSDVLLYNKSTDCGATFSPSRLLTPFTRFSYADQSAATPAPAQSGAKDGIGTDDEDAASGARRDCGDFTEACVSGYTYPRVDASPRATADQSAPASDETVYVTFEQTIPDTETPTGTTFGTVRPGTVATAKSPATSGIGGQGGVYFMSLNGATGARSTPTMIDPTDYTTRQGHQFWADVSVDGGALHFIWYDSRNDTCYSPTRPVGNCADRSVQASLDVYGTTSTDRGASFAPATRLTDVSSNPNYEQYGNRLVPFLGDYISVSSSGGESFGVWTDSRNTRTGTDAREAGDNDADPGADVLQCRVTLADGSFTGDTCPRAGGLDQDIYGDQTP